MIKRSFCLVLFIILLMFLMNCAHPYVGKTIHRSFPISAHNGHTIRFNKTNTEVYCVSSLSNGKVTFDGTIAIRSKKIPYWNVESLTLSFMFLDQHKKVITVKTKHIIIQNHIEMGKPIPFKAVFDLPNDAVGFNITYSGRAFAD